MSTPDEAAITRLDTGVPHSARLWNYWLGGKDNFAVDRAVADQILAMVPEMGGVPTARRTPSRCRTSAAWPASPDRQRIGTGRRPASSAVVVPNVSSTRTPSGSMAKTARSV